MKVYIVREPRDHILHPEAVVSIHLFKEDADKKAKVPIGYTNGDKSKPVLSGRSVEEWEVEE